MTDKVTYFRYKRHGGEEQKVPGGSITLPAHHSHYSFLEEVSFMPATTEEILAEREKTHGSFRENARVSQFLKAKFRAEDHWGQLSDMQREALDMIALKIGRILNGSANEPDHWADIAGYARLAEEGTKK